LPPALTDAQVVAMVSGNSQSNQVDRDLWWKDFNNVGSGNHVITVVIFERDGSTTVQRVPGYSVTSAIGALRGPLHGGANEDVIKLLLEAGTADKALDMVKTKLANKVKIPGFGHRVYHTLDPRATSLKGMAKELGERTGHQELYQISKQIEEYIKGAKNLNANVDFYSASTYYSLGIPIDLFTPIFAVSRMSGWTAHILEQYRNNRLIRPRAEYIGPTVGQKWVEIGAR